MRGWARHPGERRRALRRGGRAAWLGRSVTIGEQVLSGLSNALVVVLVARAVSPSDFGRFALGYGVLTLVLVIVRAYFGTRIAMSPDATVASVTAAAVASALALLSPVLVAFAYLLSSLAVGFHFWKILLVVALASPVVCCQDTFRFGAVAAARAWVALVADLLWVVIIGAPLVLSVHLSASGALLTWAVGAVVSAVVAGVLCQAPLSPRAGADELRQSDRLGQAVTVGTVVSSVSTLCVLFVVTRAIGPAGAGSLRGASNAMAPINVLLAFSSIVLVPALVRRGRGGDAAFCARVALLLVVAVSAWGAVLVLLPDPLGRAAFGNSWTGIRQVLPWTVLEYVGLSVASSAWLGMKVRRQARQLTRQRVWVGLVYVLGGSVLALVAQRVWPVSALFAVAAGVAAMLGWRELQRTAGEASTADVMASGLWAR